MSTLDAERLRALVGELETAVVENGVDVEYFRPVPDSRPRAGNLVFAGEAFVQNLQKSPSQMTGAWESGRIAGRKILKKLALAEAGQG